MRLRRIAKCLRVGAVSRLRGLEVQQAALRAPSGATVKSPSGGVVSSALMAFFETDGLLYLPGECPALIIRNLVDRHQTGFVLLRAGQSNVVFNVATMAMGGAPPVWKRVLITPRGLVSRRNGAETALAGIARLRNPL